MSDTRPVVAVMRKTYLGRSETWIHSELTSARRYRKVVFTTRTENLDRFPWPAIYMPADLPRFSAGWWADRLARCVVGRQLHFERLVERLGVRLLHAHFGYDGVWALPLKERTRLPLVTTFHGNNIYFAETLRQMRPEYPRLFERGDRFIVLGRNMHAAAVRLGCREEKLRTIHLAVDMDAWPFSERPALNGPIRLLFCSRLVEIKGLRYVLDAMKTLTERGVDAELRIIGYVGATDVPEMDHHAYARELGILDRVTFLGYQPPDGFRKELQAAHVFLQPSVTTAAGQVEGAHPITLVEAQAMGCPVIATRHSDIPEAAVDGVTGFLVDEKQPAQIADKVQWFAEHRDALSTFGRQARAHVEANNNAAVENAKLETLYDELLQAGGSRP